MEYYGTMSWTQGRDKYKCGIWECSHESKGKPIRCAQLQGLHFAGVTKIRSMYEFLFVPVPDHWS